MKVYAATSEEAANQALDTFYLLQGALIGRRSEETPNAIAMDEMEAGAAEMGEAILATEAAMGRELATEDAVENS